MTAGARQLVFDLGHRPAHGRDDFLVAACNESAVGWIDRWPHWNAPCLVIYGPAACGKSHLCSVWQSMTGAASIDTSRLGSVKADALAAQGTQLVLDNIDPWFGDRAAETTLFHLYNMMKESGRTMLLTTRMAPSHAAFALPDLASRLRAAPAASIAPPDDALLTALLVKLFSDRQIAIGHEVLAYLLPRMERSFAAARDLVAAADALALSEKKPVSIPLIRRVLLNETE